MALNAQPLNAAALNATVPAGVESEPEGGYQRRPRPGGIGTAALNTRPINGAGWRLVYVPGTVEHPPAEFELRTVYLLEIGDYRVPMSSFQATMRRQGQSFLQAVIPNGSEHLAALVDGAPMQVLMGLRAPDDTLTELEAIASAPLQIVRHDEGGGRDTLTVSGYGPLPPQGSLARELRGISYRSINQGVRRVRSQIDLLLRPGQVAIDGDGSSFMVGTIQYFVGARSEFMEVLEDGQG
ncbi:hypothetical protein EQG41_20885 [Billgrantia azerbaijanica]|nr:hypothetical protein EQG41_20885 [Halomonas azerbaijanica]